MRLRGSTMAGRADVSPTEARTVPPREPATQDHLVFAPGIAASCEPSGWMTRSEAISQASSGRTKAIAPLRSPPPDGASDGDAGHGVADPWLGSIAASRWDDIAAAESRGSGPVEL